MSRRELPVRTRETLLPDGSRKRSLSVFCPRLDQSVTASSCRSCLYAESISRAGVVCSPPVEAVRAGEGTAAGAASSATFACARIDVPVRVIVDVRSEEPWAIPVVDAQDLFVGFVSPWRGPSAELPRRLVRALPAREVLFGRALALPEGEPVRRALHEMAIHRTRIIALLDEAGILRGILTDIEALDAIAAAARANRRA